ncbi:phosphoheptose isomerase [Escherichia coli]|uniref:Phosphoheptose isomerase n=1 Tax=Escherichia coli TaxID=562 RepID=A0A377E335_ECOLX|nr:phosphoheptose isomerase [Escherichia coli]
MKVITLTGKTAAKWLARRISKFAYRTLVMRPHSGIHIKVIHILIQLIEKEMVK